MASWPLRWYHDAFRETVCFFLGHKWKCSWRSRDDRAERVARDDRGELTYREQHEGNPYCWYSAGWHYKCRRCRTRTRDDAYQPWYRTWWWAVRYGVIEASWFQIAYWIGGSLKQEHSLPGRYWPVVLLAAVVAGGAKALTYLAWIPGRLPLGWVCELLLGCEYALTDWLERRTTR